MYENTKSEPMQRFYFGDRMLLARNRWLENYLNFANNIIFLNDIIFQGLFFLLD